MVPASKTSQARVETRGQRQPNEVKEVLEILSKKCPAQARSHTVFLEEAMSRPAVSHSRAVKYFSKIWRKTLRVHFFPLTRPQHVGS